VVAVSSLVVALAAASRLGSEFLPELDEGTTWVNLTLPASISPEEAQEQMREVRAALHTVPEVHTVISKVGRPDDGTDPKILNSAELFVDFVPEPQWRRGKTKDDLIREMDAAVSAIPGMEPSFDQPIRDNVLESISQVDGQIVIKVRGDDLVRIHDEARRILDEIADVPGVARAFIDRDGSLPQYVIDIDREAAARYGVNVGDIQDVVETAMAGKSTSELWEGRSAPCPAPSTSLARTAGGCNPSASSSATATWGASWPTCRSGSRRAFRSPPGTRSAGRASSRTSSAR
jgi:cobalt-zinc-cadmium resistance protein CzcA